MMFMVAPATQPTHYQWFIVIIVMPYGFWVATDFTRSFDEKSISQCTSYFAISRSFASVFKPSHDRTPSRCPQDVMRQGVRFAFSDAS